MNIYDKMTTVFQDTFDDDSIVPNPSMTAEDVAGWDSLSHIRLMVAVEHAFGIKFATTEITGFNNVGSLATAIEKKLAEKANGDSAN